jgi:hypothetical protein
MREKGGAKSALVTKYRQRNQMKEAEVSGADEGFSHRTRRQFATCWT